MQRKLDILTLIRCMDTLKFHEKNRFKIYSKKVEKSPQVTSKTLEISSNPKIYLQVKKINNKDRNVTIVFQ